MPNDELIAALEALRDSFSQRQRATNGLLTALKGASSALGKAGRALGDYAGQSVLLDAGRLAQAQEAVAQARVKEDAVDPVLPELRRESKALATTITSLKDALTALRGEAVDVVKLGRAREALQTGKIQDESISALLPLMTRELEQAQQTLGATFGEALRAALAAQGLEATGRPPRSEIGRFEVVTDFVHRGATLSYGKEVLVPRLPLSVEAVVRTYQREARAIAGRNEDGARWIQQFHDAWETARRKRNRTGTRVGIVDCYFELVLLRQSKAFRSEPTKRRFADYTRAQFAYDLFEFVDRQQRAHNGLHAVVHGATKDQTDNPERSIWIVEGRGPHDGRYIGDVEFIGK